MLPGRGRCGRLQEGVRLLRITDSPMTCLKIGGFANGHYSKAAGNCVVWNGQQLNWQLQRWVKLVNWSLTRTEVLRSKRRPQRVFSDPTCQALVSLQVIIYLFPRTHYERLQPYASPEASCNQKNTKKAWKIIRYPWPLGLEGAWSSLGVDLFEESLVQQSRSLKEMTQSQVKWSEALLHVMMEYLSWICPHGGNEVVYSCITWDLQRSF